jgi:hypothetical protein
VRSLGRIYLVRRRNSESIRDPIEVHAPSWRAISFLEVTRASDGVWIKLDRCLESNAVLRMRTSELRQALLRTLAQLGLKQRAGHIPNELWAGNQHGIDDVATEVARRIDEIASRPCTPRQVIQILSIRTSERVRWAKDGRLKISGVAP